MYKKTLNSLIAITERHAALMMLAVMIDEGMVRPGALDTDALVNKALHRLDETRSPLHE